ncbi:MAG: orotidine-5'-phosphate decarboxylase [Bacteroidales bacterium]|nr:orotidine-5'-phosphate decarboxylase [Bacteroidales bacterium]HOY38878.1 orotidine-5'-phosphate decarboxylase [Bacteroidales bacterium]HQP04721.1 orotidine-5'-phosphate decarboxylase [Bacteroidales bacterium]
MNFEQIFEQILKKRSFLCVGLDSDIKKIPQHLLQEKEPVFEFNKAIIDATAPFSVAFKPNLAFYESIGVEGWICLDKTIAYIREHYPEIFIIADAKRGDIGNTSGLYARAFFENLRVDAVTVAPYMGEDSVSPFLSYHNKWVILLALTSNKGADDFQYLNDKGSTLYEHVLTVSQQWGNKNNMMYVVGATRAQMLQGIRKIVPEHFLLVPGVGAQGGSLKEVAEYGLNKSCGLLVNSSRNIIFANNTRDFAKAAAIEAAAMQSEMSSLLKSVMNL